MTIYNAANNAETTLSVSVNSSATTITVADASVFPDAPFKVTIDNEVMDVSAVSGNDLTVSRGAESTTAASHLAGVSVESRWTAGMYEELTQKVREYRTTNVSGSHTGYYTKVAEITLTFRYDECQLVLNFLHTNNGSGISNAKVALRVIQQDAMGSAPVVGLVMTSAYGFLNTHFVAVTTTNDSEETVVELYVVGYRTYSTIRFGVDFSYRIFKAEFFEDVGWDVALPSGSQTSCVDGT